MNKILIFLIYLIALSGKMVGDQKKITSSDELTMSFFKEVAHRTGYTDHIPHFSKIFENYPVRNFLEFGLGLSTKYFLDCCEKVISVEFVTPGGGPDWIKECIRLYDGYTNWQPIAYFSDYSGDTSWSKHSFFGSNEVYKAAAYQCTQHKNYALINNSYMSELDGFITDLVNENEVDVAFVDAGIYIRGDFVQLLFNKVPIIVAHDARCRAKGEKDDVYAYSRVSPPENYEEIFIDIGMGTMIWVEKSEEFLTLRNILKKYAHEKKWSEGW